MIPRDYSALNGIHLYHKSNLSGGLRVDVEVGSACHVLARAASPHSSTLLGTPFPRLLEHGCYLQVRDASLDDVCSGDTAHLSHSGCGTSGALNLELSLRQVSILFPLGSTHVLQTSTPAATWHPGHSIASASSGALSSY